MLSLSEGAGANLQIPAVSQSLAQWIHHHSSDCPFFFFFPVKWGNCALGTDFWRPTNKFYHLIGSTVPRLLVSNSFYLSLKIEPWTTSKRLIDFVSAACYGPDSVRLLCTEQHLSLPTCNEAIRRMIFVLCEADRQNRDMFSDTWMFIAHFFVRLCSFLPAHACYSSCRGTPFVKGLLQRNSLWTKTFVKLFTQIWFWM